MPRIDWVVRRLRHYTKRSREFPLRLLPTAPLQYIYRNILGCQTPLLRSSTAVRIALELPRLIPTWIFFRVVPMGPECMAAAHTLTISRSRLYKTAVAFSLHASRSASTFSTKFCSFLLILQAVYNFSSLSKRSLWAPLLGQLQIDTYCSM